MGWDRRGAHVAWQRVKPVDHGTKASMQGDYVDSRYWPGWRLLLALATAMLLPLIIYALITTGINYRNDRRETEAATFERAIRISEAVDARLEAVGSTIRALATIRSIGERNWSEARSRSAEIANLDPDWRSVTLFDLTHGLRLFDLRTPQGKMQNIGKGDYEDIAIASRDRPTFSNICQGPKGPEIHAYLGIGSGVTPAYLLDVALDPRIVQRVLLRIAPQAGVSAVVDGHGLFIGRTKAWPTKVGTSGTPYLRHAITNGRTGFYKGVTWEGLPNYTAFTTSSRTGWTTHVAVPSTIIDNLQSNWRLASLAAAFASIALAALLVVLLVRLIAERQRAERRQHQSERLEAVGKLTGGIAHDFNNMLAIVIGSLDLAQRRLAKGNTDIARFVDNAIDGANRAADLTRRLLAFSRGQVLTPKPVDVNALIKAMMELLGRTLSADIQIVTDLAPGLWPTFVDPGQLENALVNLAVNARDAMPDGGTLTISTANRPGGTEKGATGDAVEIEITDTGSGMAPEVVARAFEPFFTTKEVGRGTGLGLSQIHGFATQSGGAVSIRSTLGAGTTIVLTLPRHRQTESGLGGAHLSRRDPTAPEGNPTEILLLVEDEDLVRRTNVEALRNLGYTVLDASSAEDALATLESESGIKLLLTDIVMPGMNGRDLAERVAARFPEIRILLMTGFARDQVLDDSRILHKPFGLGELARRVRSELDAL
jgi:signal transduction histidine kinase/CheY-like chemotaxis protein